MATKTKEDQTVEKPRALHFYVSMFRTACGRRHAISQTTDVEEFTASSEACVSCRTSKAFSYIKMGAKRANKGGPDREELQAKIKQQAQVISDSNQIIQQLQVHQSTANDERDRAVASLKTLQMDVDSRYEKFRRAIHEEGQEADNLRRECADLKLRVAELLKDSANMYRFQAAVDEQDRMNRHPLKTYVGLYGDDE